MMLASVPMHDLIASDARELSEKLHAHRMRIFPPSARKSLRRFTSGEAAKLIGINDGYLRQLSLKEGAAARGFGEWPALILARRHPGDARLPR